MLGSRSVRVLLAAMALVLVMPMIASASYIIESDYFFPKPAPATFCAQTGAPAIQVTFTATTPQGIVFHAGPVNSNALGLACASVNWPQGVYSLVASGTVGTSVPYAISVFSALNFCGAQGGGTVLLEKYGVPPNVQQSLETREADFAFIYRTTAPKNFGVIYHDPEYPLGAITFIAKSFQTVQSDDNITYQWMEFQGSGKLTQGMAAPRTVHYDLYVDNDPAEPYFWLEIYDLAGHLLYKNDDCELFEGQNVVELCL